MSLPNPTSVTAYYPPPIPHIVRGVRNFPVETPPENIVLGNGWLRRGETATLIGTAGSGKSVASVASAMLWSAGLVEDIRSPSSDFKKATVAAMIATIEFPPINRGHERRSSVGPLKGA